MNRTSWIAVVRIAAPYVLGLALLGALVGRALGSAANGFRVGAILGGVVAFVVLRRKGTGPS